MDRNTLIRTIREKSSFLCVGLDTDPDRIPDFLSGPDGILEFNREIIQATQEHCVAYKVNTAFYESMGVRGWEVMVKTFELIPRTHFIIADAKRGDIGNTSRQYAKAFFEALDCDAVTVAPYMGSDSVKPFLDFAGKWVIILALTSNQGARDFQLTKDESGQYFYEKVMSTAVTWGDPHNTMFVVGATKAEYLEAIRKSYPDHFFLVPGVGAQGGDLRSVCDAALNEDVGLLVNSSRGIIYASSGKDYAEAAREQAALIHAEMKTILSTVKDK